MRFFNILIEIIEEETRAQQNLFSTRESGKMYGYNESGNNDEHELICGRYKSITSFFCRHYSKMTYFCFYFCKYKSSGSKYYITQIQSVEELFHSYRSYHIYILVRLETNVYQFFFTT